jgi:hypothetical protein
MKRFLSFIGILALGFGLGIAYGFWPKPVILHQDAVVEAVINHPKIELKKDAG